MFRFFLQIKFASVKLAKKYMKRVAMELQVMGASNKDPALEYMLLQGVRFAFRIHQVKYQLLYCSTFNFFPVVVVVFRLDIRSVQIATNFP